MLQRLSPAVRTVIVVGAVLALGTAVLVSIPLLMVMGGTAVTSTATGDEGTTCGPVATVAGRRIRLDGDQLANMATIVRTGRRLHVPDRGLVIAVATALQESTLRNLHGGDADSVGLFQQRRAWATTADRTDPPTSAAMFYTGGRGGQRGLLDVRGWQTMSVTDAAQAVQVSAFGNAYAKWETLAASLVQSVIGQDPLGCNDPVAASLPSGSVGAMLRVALEQQGDPYVWGAVGPDAFDCSGLVVYSWKQAGFGLTVRTAAQMWRVSTPVPRGSERPGDLLFGAFGDRQAGLPGHVMIVVRPGTAVQAPAAGRTVELTHYGGFGAGWRLARLRPSAVQPLAAPA